MNAAVRHVLAQGACNFRDLGGYPTIDGGRVRTGKIFRSGVLDRLDQHDPVVANLHMATVIDLRTGHERISRPSSIPQSWRAGHWAREYETSGGDHTAMPHDLSEAEIVAIMHKVYRRMPFEQAPAYRVLFTRLAEGAVPMLFHCLGGKDRTGVAAALLLELLQVPRQLIREDYALTEECLARDRHIIGDQSAGYSPEAQLARLPLMRADPAYLDSMFAKLSAEFGGVESYFDQVLGIDREARAHIREVLVERAA